MHTDPHLERFLAECEEPIGYAIRYFVTPDGIKPAYLRWMEYEAEDGTRFEFPPDRIGGHSSYRTALEEFAEHLRSEVTCKPELLLRLQETERLLREESDA